MGYALQAQSKLVAVALHNMAQLHQKRLYDDQFTLANNQDGLNQQLSSLTSSQSGELADLYKQLASATDESDRNTINANIKTAEENFEREKNEINEKIYNLSIRENIIEREVKRMDTMVTVLEKEVNAMVEAEGKGITNAVPKYNGLQG